MKSGRLRSSVRGNRAARRATVSVPLVYAGPVHWGWAGHNIEPNEFGVRGLARAEDEIGRTFLGGIERILDRVRGV